MERIHPTLEGCTPYVGKTVYAVLHNGTWVVGRLSLLTTEGFYIEGMPMQQAKTTAFLNPFFFPFGSLAFLFSTPFSPFFLI